MHRIRLGNTEFEGHNAAYLFDGERTVLVDTGIARPPVREQVEGGLQEHGVAVADLDAILATHWHVDHAGLVGAFQAESGATVYAHPRDADLVARDPVAEDDVTALRERKLEKWGTPSEPKAELLAFFETAEGRGDTATVTPLADGETVQAGDETLRAVHTPGHTAGHLSFVRENGTDAAGAAEDGTEAADAAEDGTVLSGDALLPKYTPNVGGADPRVDGPLGRYLETLSWFVDAEFERAYPGHRDPIEDPAARAREIIDHHEERARRVFAYLCEEGPADPWTVSAHLFGSLEGIHILHGPGEAYAHLDHMARHGLLERTGEGYRVVEGDADLASLFPA